MNSEPTRPSADRAGAIPDLVLQTFNARSGIIMLLALGAAAIAIVSLEEPLALLLALLAVTAAALSWLAAASLGVLGVVALLASGAPATVLEIVLLVGVPVAVALIARRADVLPGERAEGAAQNGVQSREALCRTIVDTALDGMLMLDEDGRVLEANAAFCDMLGVERNDVLRMHVGDWQAEFTRDQVRAMIRDGTLARGAQRFETTHRRADGSTYVAEVSARVVSFDRQRVAIASVRDISERNSAAREQAHEHAQLAARAVAQADELLAAQRHASQAVLAKESFLANVAHHLRTPTQAVLAFAGLGLQHTAGSDTPGETCFQRILRSAEQLDGFVDDLILLTSLESGERAVSLAPVNLEAQIRAAHSELTVVLNRKEIELAAEVPPGASAMLDAALLRRLLAALLAHAVRRSPAAATIDLTLREKCARGSADIARAGYTLSVRDAGAAVDDASRARYFDAFFDRTTPPAGGDTGLSLALAAQIVRVHGGTIRAQSGENGGLTVSLWLPRDGPPQAVADGASDTADSA